MSDDPNTVFTVALSRAQINELLCATAPTNGSWTHKELATARTTLRRAVRPTQASNDERIMEAAHMNQLVHFS